MSPQGSRREPVEKAGGDKLTTTETTGLVRVRELGALLSPGVDIFFWLDRCRVKLATTWDNQPAVAERDARKVLETYRREIAENEDRHRRHALYLRERQAERERVGQEAAERALAEAVAEQRALSDEINRGGHGGWAPGAFPIKTTADPQARNRASNARWAAQRKFDTKHREKSLEEFK